MSIGDLVEVNQATRPADAQVQHGVSQQRARETTATQGGALSPALSALQHARLERQLEKVARDLAAARDLQFPQSQHEYGEHDRDRGRDAQFDPEFWLSPYHQGSGPDFNGKVFTTGTAQDEDDMHGHPIMEK